MIEAVTGALAQTAALTTNAASAGATDLAIKPPIETGAAVQAASNVYRSIHERFLTAMADKIKVQPNQDLTPKGVADFMNNALSQQREMMHFQLTVSAADQVSKAVKTSVRKLVEQKDA